MKLHNLTPHTIRVSLAREHGDALALSVYESEGCARIGQTSTAVDVADECEIAEPTYGDVAGLPPPAKGHLFIVSMMVAQAAPERRDLVWPDSGPDAERRDGQVWAVRRLLRLAPPVEVRPRTTYTEAQFVALGVPDWAIRAAVAPPPTAGGAAGSAWSVGHDLLTEEADIKSYELLRKLFVCHFEAEPTCGRDGPRSADLADLADLVEGLLLRPHYVPAM